MHEKKLFLILLAGLLAAGNAYAEQPAATSIYDFVMTDIDGNTVPLSA
jgi:hypothetical protein